MRLIVVIILLVSVLSACKNNQKGEQGIDMRELEKALIEQNKQVHQKQRAGIDAFIAEKGWTMTETGTGLWYEIVENGKDSSAIRSSSIVDLRYTIDLLNGKEVSREYATKERNVKVGYSQMESGLHEALQLMHRGDSARLVMPSNLAHGFTGDLEGIPFDSPLVFHLRILEK